jgi:hypothetical protein
MVVKGKSIQIKQIVAKQFADWYEEGQLIRHIDGNKQNNALSNLYVQSREEQQRDRQGHRYGVQYQTIAAIPPGFRKFVRCHDWQFNDYYSDGDVMLMRINDKKYRVCHVVQAHGC